MDAGARKKRSIMRRARTCAYVRVRGTAATERLGRSTLGMTLDRPLLDHENLDVYRLALEFLSLSLRVLEALPTQRRELRSQLERAAMSVPLEPVSMPALEPHRITSWRPCFHIGTGKRETTGRRGSSTGQTPSPSCRFPNRPLPIARAIPTTSSLTARELFS